MRIMYLSVSGGLGGAERSLFDILASLRAAEPSWALRLISAADGPLVAAVAGLDIDAAIVPMPGGLARIGEGGASSTGLVARLAGAAVPVCRYVRQLRREIRRFAPDVLHTNNLKMHLLGAWAAPRRTAVVWHLHDYIGARKTTTRLLRMNAHRAAAIVANSSSVADDARVSLGSRIPIVPVLNAVDLQRFSTAGRQLNLDQLAGMPPGPADVIRVGLLATFGRWKGHQTFLEAIARLPRSLPVRAYIVGGALYETEGSQHTLDDLRDLAEALHVTDRVGFTGFVANPEEAIRALDVVVHASTAPEPFGLVIAEAMACGRPVIASNAGGAREIFTPGVEALAHQPGSADELASQIVELVRDGRRRTAMGMAGRQTAERRFDRARLATDLLPVYERAVARV